MTASKNQLSYEELTTELDTVIAVLQREDTNVDEALMHYKRGLEVIKLLEAQLTSAKNSVTELKASFNTSAS